jgi:hypothetical protein
VQYEANHRPPRSGTGAKATGRLARQRTLVFDPRNWLEANRALNMGDLEELKKTQLRKAA